MQITATSVHIPTGSITSAHSGCFSEAFIYLLVYLKVQTSSPVFFRFRGGICCHNWPFGPLELAHAALISHSNLNKGAFMSCSICGEMNWPPLVQMKYYLSSDEHHHVSGPACWLVVWLLFPGRGFELLKSELNSSEISPRKAIFDVKGLCNMSSMSVNV